VYTVFTPYSLSYTLSPLLPLSHWYHPAHTPAGCFLRNLYTVFQNGWMSSHSWQQCTRGSCIPVNSHLSFDGIHFQVWGTVSLWFWFAFLHN
jgi:hypothetical protein